MSLNNIHRFQDNLALSNSIEISDWWTEKYKIFFPNMASIIRNQRNNYAQRLGIDTVILLDSGKLLRVDEKIRTNRPNALDVAIEYEHVFSDGKTAPGWIKKPLLIDYLAYGFTNLDVAYLLPWDLLRSWWLNKGHTCIKKYGPRIAKNKSYNTYFIPVPIQELIEFFIKGT